MYNNHDCCILDNSTFDRHMAGMDRPIGCMIKCLLLILCDVTLNHGKSIILMTVVLILDGSTFDRHVAVMNRPHGCISLLILCDVMFVPVYEANFAQTFVCKQGYSHILTVRLLLMI